MKIKNGFILRKISDTYVVVAVGEAAKNFTGMITLNSTGGFLWEKLSEGADEAQLAEALMAEYDVDEETAKKDAADFVKKMLNSGFAE